MKSDIDPESKESSCKARKFSVIEKNAIYYTAGYVVQKLIKKFRRSSDDDACIYTGVLLHMVGEGTSGAIQENDSYFEYVKAWTKATDRGGLKHASEDTYRFFLALENRVYELIKRGEQKAKVVGETMDDENLVFHWEITIQTCQMEGSLLSYYKK